MGPDRECIQGKLLLGLGHTVDLTFFGNCSSSESVFLHETSHNLDYRVVGAGSWYSQTDEWKTKVAQGSCVADNYAKSCMLRCYHSHLSTNRDNEWLI